MGEGYRLLQCTETVEAPLEEQTCCLGNARVSRIHSVAFSRALPRKGTEHPLMDLSPDLAGLHITGLQPQPLQYLLVSHWRGSASAGESREVLLLPSLAPSLPSPRFLAFPVAFKKHPCPPLNKYTVWDVTVMTRNPVAPRQNDRLILSGSEFGDVLFPPTQEHHRHLTEQHPRTVLLVLVASPSLGNAEA